MIKAILSVGLLLVASIAQAAPGSLSCGTEELLEARTPINFIPSTNGDGTVHVFISTEDFTGGNPNREPQLFLFNANTVQTVQLTDGVDGGSFFSTTAHALTADGGLVVFASPHDPTGGNSDGNIEIFLYNVATQQYSQITNTSGDFVSSGFPAISDDGSTIVFYSNANPLGTNADSGTEVFLYTVGSGVLRQATNVNGVHLNDRPTINGDGTSIAYTSNANLDTFNADGNAEIYIQNTVNLLLSHLTNTTGVNNAEPQMDDTGDIIVFVSDGDLDPMNNADGNDEIFVWENGVGFTQVTMTTTGDTSSPTVSGNGARVAFVSDQDLVGTNMDENEEIFYWERVGGMLFQATDTTINTILGNSFPTYSGDAQQIVFTGTIDAGGGMMGSLPFFTVMFDNPEIVRFDHASGMVVAVTDTETNLISGLSISGDGNRLALDGILQSIAPPSNQLQIYEGPLGLPFGPQRVTTDGVSFIFFGGDRLSNADGSVIAFASSGNPAGNNADESVEGFLYDTSGPTFIQMTDSGLATDRFVVPTAISDDGMRVVMFSDADLTGQNADNSLEVFLFDRNGNTLQQITDGPAGTGALGARISRDGTMIAFGSTTDPTGGNADLGPELFIYDIAGTTFTQLTTDAVDISGIDTNEDGTLIALHSSDDFTGQNADGNNEIFLFDVAGASITQITNTSTGENEGPRINADGSVIAFRSNADIDGTVHGTENDIIIYDRTTSTFIQVSAPSDIPRTALAADASGRTFAYVEADGSFGLGSLGARLVLAQCAPVRPVPALNPAMLTGLAVLLVAMVAPALRRRQRMG